MQKLSLDPVPLLDSTDPGIRSFRDNVQLNFNKLQDYINLLLQSVNPTGIIVGMETANAVPGYLLLDGSSFSSSTYPDLSTFLGGTTLPDYRGRTPVGRDSGQTEFATLGQTGGSKTTTAPHTHLLANHNHGGSVVNTSVAHGHTVNSHNHGGGTGVHGHTVSGTVQTGTSGHLHDNTAQQLASRPTGAISFMNAGDPITNSVGVGNTFESPGTGGMSASDPHGHTIPQDNAASGPSSAAATSGNLVPYRVLNWFIKT